MSDDTLRRIDLTRLGKGRYRATNARGVTLDLGSGDDTNFTPVELLLAAIAGCSATDVDLITSKRSEPSRFELTMTGDKVRGELGNRMTNLVLSFDVTFPDDEAGLAAVAILPRAVEQTRSRLCTVSRTIEVGTPIEVEV